MQHKQGMLQHLHYTLLLKSNLNQRMKRGGVGSVQIFQLPPTVRRHFMSIGETKLAVGV